jgi:hypothetical protein
VLDLTLKLILKENTNMSAIENFARLSAEEQNKFAEALVKTINSEGIFSAVTDFRITGIEANDITGGLAIEVSHTNPIEVSRNATWTCDSEDYAEIDPGSNADFTNTIFEDVEKAFKTLSAVVDGYAVSLDISDVDETDTIEVEVDSISYEDAGIGDYEYFGFTGTDSQPYVEVDGTIVKECECALTFFVELDTIFEDDTEEI